MCGTQLPEGLGDRAPRRSYGPRPHGHPQAPWTPPGPVDTPGPMDTPSPSPCHLPFRAGTPLLSSHRSSTSSWPSSWTTLTTSRGTGPSWALITWTSSRPSGQSTTRRLRESRLPAWGWTVPPPTPPILMGDLGPPPSLASESEPPSSPTGRSGLSLPLLPKCPEQRSGVSLG